VISGIEQRWQELNALLGQIMAPAEDSRLKAMLEQNRWHAMEVLQECEDLLDEALQAVRELVEEPWGDEEEDVGEDEQ
jgi:hypothetical protein